MTGEESRYDDQVLFSCEVRLGYIYFALSWIVKNVKRLTDLVEAIACILYFLFAGAWFQKLVRMSH